MLMSALCQHISVYGIWKQNRGVELNFRFSGIELAQVWGSGSFCSNAMLS